MISFFYKYKSLVKDSDILKRLINGSIWSVFGNLLASGITLVMWMIVARLIGKENYGQLVLIQSTLAMVGVFAGFGIGSAATRYAAELKEINRERLGHILALAERSILLFGMVGTVLLIICSESMATSIFNRPALSMPLKIAAVTIFFISLDSYQKSVLIGIESMRSYALGTISGVLLSVPIIIISVNSYSISGAAAGIAFASGIQALISYLQVRNELKKYKIKKNAKGSFSESRVMFHFALPALISGILVGPAHWTVQAILANKPNGYAELAVLGIAMQWFQIIQFIPNAAARAVLPVLTASVSNENIKHSKSVILHSVGINIFCVLPFLLLMIIFGKYIYGLYGMPGDNRSLTLPLAALAASINVILNPVGMLLAAKSKMWLGAAMNSIWAFTYISSSLIFIQYGANGVLLSLGIGYIAHAVWVSYFAYGELWKK